MMYEHLEFQKYDLKDLTDTSLQHTDKKPDPEEGNILRVSQRVDKMEAVVDRLQDPSNYQIR